MNLSALIEREDPDRCSAPLCRKQSEITYLPGATEANPTRRVGLCDVHHGEFSDLRHVIVVPAIEPLPLVGVEVK